MKFQGLAVSLVGAAIVLGASGCGKTEGPTATGGLTDAEIDNIVRRSYQYVAMYNVNNKFALKQGGWNTVDADTQLKDHTMREIARPNNDTLYVSALLDLRKDPVILEMPAFDSDYVSLMVTGYDHYVNVPMATRLGDFKKPEKMLFYTERTEGYDGAPVEGVDQVFEASGDFISAVLRIMPHANDEERFNRIVQQMEQVGIETLSEFRGEPAKPIDDVEFPAVGQRDADIFGDNLLEVMQFVFNHTTFHADNELDQALLAAYEPLGVVPGQPYDAAEVATIDAVLHHEDRCQRHKAHADADQREHPKTGAHAGGCRKGEREGTTGEQANSAQGSRFFAPPAMNDPAQGPQICRPASAKGAVEVPSSDEGRIPMTPAVARM